LVSTPREWRLTDSEGETHAVPVSGALQSNNGLVNRAAAISGAGIVLLPAFYIGEELRSGRLKAVLPDFKAVELAIYAVYPERRNLTPKVRAFVDFLAGTFADAPWEKVK
jgi:DNA-binding transcriptional LysR family regulator